MNESLRELWANILPQLAEMKTLGKPDPYTLNKLIDLLDLTDSVLSTEEPEKNIEASE